MSLAFDLASAADEYALTPCDCADCGHDGSWSLRCDGCAHVTLCCHAHKVKFDEFLRPVCTVCAHPYPLPIPFLRL